MQEGSLSQQAVILEESEKDGRESGRSEWEAEEGAVL
jgi:hypothetical protein